MEGQIILAVAIAIPIILTGAAFVWFLSASGLYHVIRATQRRQKRRAQALREAQHVI